MYFLKYVICYRTPDIGYDFDTNKGLLYNYYTTGVGCSEVEIDCLTGDHHVCDIKLLFPHLGLC